MVLLVVSRSLMDVCATLEHSLEPNTLHNLFATKVTSLYPPPLYQESVRAMALGVELLLSVYLYHVSVEWIL